MRSRNAIRTVAVFEAAKGILVLLVGIGALSFIDRDLQPLAERLVGHAHLNPARQYPRIFIEAAAHMTDTKLWLLAAFAATYALLRLVEAYGLWHELRWAEWFAAVSGAIYVPLEIYELWQRVSWLSVGALVVNVLIVALMVNVLLRREPVELVNAARSIGP